MCRRIRLIGWLIGCLLVLAAGADDPGALDVLTPVRPSGANHNALQPGTRTYEFTPVRYRWKQESSLGEKAAPAIEKEYGGVVEEGAPVERLGAIATRLVEAARRVGPPQRPIDVEDEAAPRELPVQVRLLKSDVVNAFSVWGGRIYVTQGLLAFVRSDDELAGVLAHELAHTMLHHLKSQTRVEERLEQVQLGLILASLFSEGQLSPADVLVFSEWAKMEVVNTHSRRDETESDRFGLLYAFEAGYSPVGLLTFMERLAHRSMSTPIYELGAAQTHPWSNDRALLLQQQLRDWGLTNLLPLKRRSARSLELESREGTRNEVAYLALCAKVFGQNEVELARLASPGQAGSLQERAQAIMERLEALFQLGLRDDDLYAEGATVYSRLSPEGRAPVAVLRVEPEDAAVVGAAPEEFAGRVILRFQRLFAMERIAVAY